MIGRKVIGYDQCRIWKVSYCSDDISYVIQCNNEKFKVKYESHA